MGWEEISSRLLPLFCSLLLQPDTASLRRLYEQEFERRHTAQAARDLGQFLARHGDPAAARSALREALRMEPENLTGAFELGLVSSARDAEPLLVRASGSKDTALAARSFEALGHLRDATGDTKSAAQAYRSAVKLRERANTLEALANDVEPAEAIRLLQRALAINRSELGARHPQTATTQANLAGKLLNAGQVEASVRMVREAMAVFEERLGPDHPRVAACAAILAYGLRAKGDWTGAEHYYRRAIEIDKTISDARTLSEFLKAP